MQSRVKTSDIELQDRLQQLAQEVVSEVSKLDPVRGKEVLGQFVSDLFVSVAEQERRELRRQKQAEGIAAAKARGVHFGRTKKPLPENFDQYYAAWQDGRMTAAEVSEVCGISKATFYNMIDRVRSEACSAQ